MATRTVARRRSTPSAKPNVVNPFGTTAPAPRGVRPASTGSRFVPPKVDPDEAKLYSQVAPGMRGSGGRAVSPQAVTAATSRMTADATRISPAARAAAYRKEFLPAFDEEVDIDEDTGEVAALAPTPVVQPRTARAPIHPPGFVDPTFNPIPMQASRARPTNALALQPVTPFDVDRLWDWIREDGDMGATLLGREFDSSLSLHEFVQSLVMAERQGIAIARSLMFRDQHLGFVMLSPILSSERIALVHCYLAPSARDKGEALTVELVKLAAETLPDFKLAIPSPSPEWSAFHKKVLGPLGFVAHTMFVR